MIKKALLLVLPLLLVITVSVQAKAFFGIVPSGKSTVGSGSVESGLLISSVIDDSPAQSAGLRSRDVLVSFDGKQVEDIDDLTFYLRKLSAGDKVEIAWYSGGKQFTSKVTLIEYPQKEKIKKIITYEQSFNIKSKTFLGVGVLGINDNLLEFFGVEDGSGVLVDAIVNGSPAEKAGILVGDIIINISGHDVDSPGRLSRLIRKNNPGDEIEIRVMREHVELNFLVELTDRDFSDLPAMPEFPEALRFDFPELPEFPTIPELRKYSSRIKVNILIPGLEPVVKAFKQLKYIY
jgi:S1-C subfamily serine protease